MRALTVCQPWAWAIAAGQKRVENRSWSTGYRGPVLIHAGRSRRWLPVARELFALGYDVPAELVFGGIVAVGFLQDQQQYDGDGELGDDPFAHGPYCWRLSQVRALSEPVLCGGMQGLWRPSVELVEKVAEHLGPREKVPAAGPPDGLLF